MIGAAVAILAWIRWRDGGETVALYESSAFVALTVINALMIAIVIVGREADFGLAATSPGEAPDLPLDPDPRHRRGDPRHRRRAQPPPRAAATPPSILVDRRRRSVLVAGRRHAVRARGEPAAGAGRRGVRPERAARARRLSPCSTADRAPPGRDLRRLHRRRDPPSPAVRPVRARVRRVPVRGARRGRLQPAALRARPGRRFGDRDLDRRAAARLLRDPGDGHPGRDRWRLRGSASRQRRAQAVCARWTPRTRRWPNGRGSRARSTTASPRTCGTPSSSRAG